jgi:polysaccharide biosynthesis/export protein
MQLSHRQLDGLIRSTLPYALTLLLGCGSNPATKNGEVIANTPTHVQVDPQIAQAYRIGIGDELNFRFIYTPELNTVAVVRPDGRVTLPLIGEMPVVGRTFDELAQQVEHALSERVRRPQVAINVQGPMASQRVFIGGEVGKPGVQPLVGPLTVAQAVLAAEGLKDTAQAREVLVLRSGPNNEQVALKVDLASVMEGRDGARDIALSPYDVVIVPRTGIANVGVWVDQYIRRVLPIGLGFSYSINRDGGVVR